MKTTLHYTTLFLFFACLLITTAQYTYAQWSNDPTVNTPICTATGDQFSPTIVSDGSGGAIITWSDYRSGTNMDIYAQRINALGTVQWTLNGVPICTATGGQELPTIISDGSGGAIITWQDLRSGSYDIYAQRINASGQVQWTANGVPICTATGGQERPTIISDGSEGAIITWQDLRSGNYDIYAQRINALGQVQWTANGVSICTATGGQERPTIISDGSGGAIITWQDLRSGNYDIYAQRINTSGQVQWTGNGVAICTITGHQRYPMVVSEGSQGAIITWEDLRSGTYWDIYAQRINASGTVQWAGNGVAVSTAAGHKYNPKIVSDGSEGAIIAWYDQRSGTNWDIYAQRINASGTVQWTPANGIVICTATGDQELPNIVSEGSGGAIITWQDLRSGNYDIYAQSINALGQVQWAGNGVAVSTITGNQQFPTIVTDGSQGAIITWLDRRSGTNWDIYAQRIFSDGALPVELVSFTAGVMNGGVELLWKTETEVNNYGFEIERTPLSPPFEKGGKQGGWEKIGFVQGHGNSNSPKEYSFIDKTVSSGKYSYRLKQIDTDGQFEYSNIVEVDLGSPLHFSLEQNYPNPFNSTTTIKYSIPTPPSSSPLVKGRNEVGFVSLKVYDVLGREVETLLDEELEAGTYERKWNAVNIPSGVYFYQLKAGSFVETKKLILLK